MIFKRIKKWNKERGLLDKKFNTKKEVSFILEESQEILRSQGEHGIIDGFADIIVFATGAIYKKGYDAEKVMAEVLKEIESRKGKIVNGKWQKNQNLKTYKANFKNCKF